VTEIIHQIVGTVLLRPYFVAFLLAYFLASSATLDVRRAFLFALAGYAIAWLSEYSSIHIGLPYGHYYYIEPARRDELWIFGVPFMDSMSFVFLSYAAYSVALAILSPTIRGRGLYLLESLRIRRSLGVRLLGALLFVYLDIIIDPISLRGNRWFLGQIYGYPEGGSYFGVPISNFVGWFVVGFFLIYALQLIDRLQGAGARNVRRRTSPRRFMLGPLLYTAIILFNLSITYAIGEYNILWADIFIVVLSLCLLCSLPKHLHSRINHEETIRGHVTDFRGVTLPPESRRLSGKRSGFGARVSGPSE